MTLFADFLKIIFEANNPKDPPWSLALGNLLGLYLRLLG